MVELNSVLMLFMLEASVVLFILILLIFLFSKNNRKKEYAASAKVIDQLQDTENIKAKKLASLFSTHCKLEQEVLNSLLTEIKSSERNLYQQIIKTFLTRDVKLLGKIEQQIDKISEPYCKVISHASSGKVEDKESEEKLQRLTEENKRLAEQLTIAMNTMDEISAEYTRVFSGTQTELELENSSKKMFDIFQQASQKIGETIREES